MGAFATFSERMDSKVAVVAEMAIEACRYKARLLGVGRGARDVILEKSGWINPFNFIDGTPTRVWLESNELECRAFLIFDPRSKEISCTWYGN